MNDLIKITPTKINNEQIQTVNARELHEFLEVKRQFANWIQERIEQYNFCEGADYLINKIVSEYNQVVMIDYHISIDMAKELSMVERNEKGKQARQYFIQCENKLKKVKTSNIREEINATKTYKAFQSIAKLVYSDKNQANLAANKATKKIHNIDCLQLMDATALICEKQEKHYTASDIGALHNKSAQMINKILKEKDIIEDYRDNKGRLNWIPTLKGKDYVIFKDTNKKHSNGTPVQQMFFLESVLDLIK